MKSKRLLRAVMLAGALLVGLLHYVGRVHGQVECADSCLNSYFACANGSASCEDALNRCLEGCLREGQLQ